jgi:hypothetical protein
VSAVASRRPEQPGTAREPKAAFARWPASSNARSGCRAELDEDTPGYGKHYCIPCRCVGEGVCSCSHGGRCARDRRPAGYLTSALAPPAAARCSRYFQSEEALLDHSKTKLHKRKVKTLLTSARPHNKVDAEVAAGMGRPDNGPKLRSGGAVDMVH